MVKLLVPWLHWNARHRPSGLEDIGSAGCGISKTGRLVVDSPWVVDGWCLMVSMILGAEDLRHAFQRVLETGARIYTSASHPFLGWDPSLFKKHQWSQKRLRCSVMRRCESQECDSTQLGGGFKFFSFSPQHQSWFIEKSLHQMMQRSCDWRRFSKSPSFGVSENVSPDTKVQRHTYNIYILYIFIYIWYISIYYIWYIFIVCFYNNACLLFC